ncbi:VTC domain-containing protein [Tirmania nivea]|nr:VTC domain-containing protein [Tirmania nivea]
MRFGKTLQSAIYQPWRDHYIEYSKLKRLLREGDDDSDAEGGESAAARARLRQEEERPWTEHDESVFVEELVNVQLEKVHSFQLEMSRKLKERTEACEQRLEGLVKKAEEERGKGKGKVGGEEANEPQQPLKLTGEESQTVLKNTLKELDDITFYINQLQKFSRINFTGFLKAAKKHDRRTRGAEEKGKKKANGEGGGPMVRPLLQVRLSALEFNKEVYSPMLYRLSAMYAFVRQQLELDGKADGQARPTEAGEIQPGQEPSSKRYTSHKFWVHPDNYLEVKTYIVRRLPVLVYNPQHKKQVDIAQADPTIHSLYFDNPKFSLYTDKVEKKPGAASLRLRWYGNLTNNPEISLERKTMQGSAITDNTNADAVAQTDDSEGAVEERITFKGKYVEAFLRGEYHMERNLQKIRDRQDKSAEDVGKYEALVKDLQSFIKDNDLQPMMRAVYNRSAFQIPGDDSIRVSLDTNLAFIREDALDPERPCRDPDDWHRKDFDQPNMEWPFSSIRKGEIHRFPYALLEIKILDIVPQKNVMWIYELMNSHLVSEASRFSKFVHGVSTLYEDYVNIFPFWLGEMDKDIRKNPETAWQNEQERKAKQAADEFAVGSLRVGSAFAIGGRFGSAPRPGMWSGSQQGGDSYKLDSNLAAGSPKKKGPSPRITELTDDEAEELEEPSLLLGGQASERFDEAADPSTNTKASLLDLFPGFSTSRYGRRHRRRTGASGDSDDDERLPPGVTKPEKLLMHSTPVNVEPKVWLANQRTFIKWEHVSILLATLSLGLYNAAGQHNNIARTLGLVYTGIALFTGIWGYWVYLERCRLIMERSGKDFDKKLGPVVVCLGLAIALCLNFGFKVSKFLVGCVVGGGWEWCRWEKEL